MKEQTSYNPPDAVGVPLSPTVLHEYRREASIGKGFGKFNPEGHYVNNLVMYKSDGKQGLGWGNNRIYGHIRIERIPAEGDQSFTLKVDRSFETIIHAFYNTHAIIECANDALATPKGWQQTVRFTNGVRKPMPELDIDEKVSIEGSTLKRTVDGKTDTETIEPNLTTEFSLFDAVQRLSFDETNVLEFNMLEDLKLNRANQRLSYRGVRTVVTQDGQVDLHLYQQTGHGVIPYEYWVGDNHRILYVVSGNLAYVNDFGA
jgi:hypothetical protein